MTQPVPNDPRIRRMEQFTETPFQVADNATPQALPEILEWFTSHVNHPPLDEHASGKVCEASPQRVIPLKVTPVLEAIQRFVREKCIVPYSYETTTFRTKTAVLHQVFLRYIDDHNEDLPNVSLLTFARALKKLGIPVKRTAEGSCRPIVIR